MLLSIVVIVISVKMIENILLVDKSKQKQTQTNTKSIRNTILR